jgi:hypothetical protein
MRLSHTAVRVLVVLCTVLGAAGCGGGGGNGVADNCDATEARLEGTWNIDLRTAVSCGTVDLHTDDHNYGPVTATTAGNNIDFSGPELSGSVDHRTCSVEFTFIDEDQNAALTCECEYNPTANTIPGHCTRVFVDQDGDGTRERNCAISDVDAFVTISN